MEKIVAKASLQIQKTKSEVFNAIVKADNLSKYFVESATEDLIESSMVQWKFPEFDMLVDVYVLKVITNNYISFNWNEIDSNKKVEIFLSSQEDNSTVVKILEHYMDLSLDGVEQVIQQTEGWANFLACLKAWIQYDINLRKDSFNFLKNMSKI